MKSYHLNLREANAFVAHQLQGYIGYESLSNNYAEVVRLAVEAMVSPTVDYPISNVINEITSYGVSPSVAREIYANLNGYLTPAIKGYLSINIGTHQYQVNVQGTELIIVDMGLIGRQAMPINNYNDIFALIKKDVDNGDWVPPNVRQLAGLL